MLAKATVIQGEGFLILRPVWPNATRDIIPMVIKPIPPMVNRCNVKIDMLLLSACKAKNIKPRLMNQAEQYQRHSSGTRQMPIVCQLDKRKPFKANKVQANKGVK